MYHHGYYINFTNTILNNQKFGKGELKKTKLRFQICFQNSHYFARLIVSLEI